MPESRLSRSGSGYVGHGGPGTLSASTCYQTKPNQGRKGKGTPSTPAPASGGGFAEAVRGWKGAVTSQ